MTLFQKPVASGANGGTLGEKAFTTGFAHLYELLDFVRNNDRRRTAAGSVRLIEAVQPATRA